MRYATLAILLLSGLFGMSAPVIEASPTCVVTVDVTGPAAISDGQTSCYVTANVGGTTGNYFYNIQIRIGGHLMYTRSFITSSPTINKIVDMSPWGLVVEGASFETKVTVSGVVDTLTVTIGP